MLWPERFILDLNLTFSYGQVIPPLAFIRPLPLLGIIGPFSLGDRDFPYSSPRD